MSFTRRFFYLGVPVLLFCALVAFGFDTVLTQRFLNQIRLEEQKSLNNLQNFASSPLIRDIGEVITDLAVMVSHQELLDLVSTREQRYFDELATEWTHYSEIVPEYAQIRWIDETGMERLRIDRRDGQSIVVPEEQLQQKSQRYYFNEGMRAEQGEFYLSALDLNMENGEISFPIEPMLRVATRVFDRQRREAGLVVINYRADDMILDLQTVLSSPGRQVWVVSSGGYWLAGPSRDLEWGQFLDKPDASVAQQYPDAWQLLSESDQGQFELDSGIWTVSTLYAQRTGQLNPDTYVDSFALSRAQGLEPGHAWKVVLFQPRSQFEPTLRRITAIAYSTAGAVLMAMLIGAWFLARALTHNAHARRELQEAEFKYRTIADHTYDWETWSDTNGQWIYCSPACERITGYSSDLFVKDKKFLLTFTEPEARDALRRHMFEHHEQRSPDPHFLTYQIRHKNGDVRWIEHACQPVYDDQGRFAGRRGSNRDVTERKAAEAALEEARAAADRASRAKSEFLANMSHEIRTPMNAIVGFSDLLRGTQMEQQQVFWLRRISQAGQHLLSIINSILDLSKIEAGKLELFEEPFDLRELCDDIEAMFSDQFSAKGLDFSIQLFDAPPFLIGDATRLRQILLNLVGNAVKFTESGGVQLRVSLQSEDPEGSLIRFAVQDTGVGIAQADLERLFNPFEQVDESSTRVHGGTGLGLAIARNLSVLMGGDAGAESEPGKGSTFWFTARLETAEAPPTPAKSHAEGQVNAERLKSDFGGARVLLVEDNAINREVAEIQLRRAGLEVETAANGKLAVASVRDREYDLILMDVQMPVMDGLEATREMLSQGCPVPILAMTANVFKEDRAACVEAGMDDFVAKPIVPEQLFEVLHRWLSISRART